MSLIYEDTETINFAKLGCTKMVCLEEPIYDDDEDEKKIYDYLETITLDMAINEECEKKVCEWEEKYSNTNKIYFIQTTKTK